MLKTRLWMGSILILLTVGMLLVDQHLAPWYPFLFVFQVGLGLLGCLELIHLLGPERAPQKATCIAGVVLIGVANWAGHHPQLDGGPWLWILGTLAAVNLLIFFVEMATFTGPNRCVAQQRWLFALPDEAASIAIAMTIFVPKMCDTGAYFTGRLIGKHPMTPVLSPKKTWEGAVGGFTFACLTAILLDRLGPAPVLGLCWACEIGFGLSVGLAGMLGDLAESLVKRDCQKKDASQAVPGFGGILDVVDAVIFAAPVAFLWFVITST